MPRGGTPGLVLRVPVLYVDEPAPMDHTWLHSTDVTGLYPLGQSPQDLDQSQRFWRRIAQAINATNSASDLIP